MKLRTAIFLLRLRYLQHDGGTPTLAEETVAWGVRGIYPDVTVLDTADASRLLDTVQATGSVPAAEKREVLAETLGWWPLLEQPLATCLPSAAAGWQRNMLDWGRCWAPTARRSRPRRHQICWGWWCCCRRWDYNGCRRERIGRENSSIRSCRYP